MRIFRYKFLFSSIVLSVLSLLCVLVINPQIWKRFNESGGKTKALFGLVELGYLNEKLFITVLGILACILSVVGYKIKEPKKYLKYVIFLSF